MAGVKLESVGKRFGRTTVVDRISLDIRDGEFMTLVGPSGCGKSTTLNMIAGLEESNEGIISFDGEDVRGKSPRERDVAFVFQSYALYPHKSVRANMAFPLEMAGMRKAEIEERIKWAAGLLGIGNFLDRMPKELSGGQRQRVALGRAIVRKPKVFLLDEPLSNLDAKLRVQMRGELKRLHQDLGTTFIYVTHDQTEAMTLSDRLAVMNEGAIQQCGGPAEIYNEPANRFVAGFIGSPPMNFVEVVAEEWGAIKLAGTGNYIAGSPLSGHQKAGRYLTMGVRPEDVVVSKQRIEVGLAAKIYVLEPTGSETYVTAVLNSSRIVARAAASFEGKAGDEIFLGIPRHKMIFFDSESGARVKL